MSPRVLGLAMLAAIASACTSFGAAVSPADDAAAPPPDGATGPSSEAGPLDAGALDGAPVGADAEPPRDARAVDGAPVGPWGAIFVSIAGTKGAMGDSQGVADTLCMNESRTLRPGVTFAAMLSVAPGDGFAARLRGSTGPRYVPGQGGTRGARAVVNVADPSSVLGPVTAHADGSSVSTTALVWTGGFDRAASGQRCAAGGVAWTSENAGFAGTVGRPTLSGPEAGAFELMTCDAPQALYCVEIGSFP